MNSRESQDFNHALQLLENAQITNFKKGMFLGISISHTLSPTSFFQLNESENKFNYNSHLFDEPMDIRYITPDSIFLAQQENRIPDHIIALYGDQVQYYPAYSLYRAGVDNRRFERETKTTNYKIDFTSQINNKL